MLLDNGDWTALQKCCSFFRVRIDFVHEIEYSTIIVKLKLLSFLWLNHKHFWRGICNSQKWKEINKKSQLYAYTQWRLLFLLVHRTHMVEQIWDKNTKSFPLFLSGKTHEEHIQLFILHGFDIRATYNRDEFLLI